MGCCRLLRSICLCQQPCQIHQNTACHNLTTPRQVCCVWRAGHCLQGGGDWGCLLVRPAVSRAWPAAGWSACWGWVQPGMIWRPSPFSWWERGCMYIQPAFCWVPTCLLASHVSCRGASHTPTWLLPACQGSCRSQTCCQACLALIGCHWGPLGQHEGPALTCCQAWAAIISCQWDPLGHHEGPALHPCRRSAAA